MTKTAQKCANFVGVNLVVNCFHSFLLIFQISVFQWLKCWNLKDEVNCSHNGGGVAYLLQILAIHFNHTVQYLLYEVSANCERERKNKHGGENLRKWATAVAAVSDTTETTVTKRCGEMITIDSADRHCETALVKNLLEAADVYMVVRGPNLSRFVRQCCTSRVQYKVW